LGPAASSGGSATAAPSEAAHSTTPTSLAISAGSFDTVEEEPGCNPWRESNLLVDTYQVVPDDSAAREASVKIAIAEAEICAPPTYSKTGAWSAASMELRNSDSDLDDTDSFDWFNISDDVSAARAAMPDPPPRPCPSAQRPPMVLARRKPIFAALMHGAVPLLVAQVTLDLVVNMTGAGPLVEKLEGASVLAYEAAAVAGISSMLDSDAS